MQPTAAGAPIPDVDVSFDFSQRRQTMLGMGGNFCQPRYGAIAPMDAVGEYCLSHLAVAHARIGLPLDYWTPQPGVYADSAQARASLLALQMMQQRGIPTVASVWAGPEWMMGERSGPIGRLLPPDRYADCIEAIVRYLTTARDEYGVEVEFFSFNEPDLGVEFLFTSQTMADFIRQAGPRFASSGLATKFLVGDTANGEPFAPYAEPILEDESIAPYLGPLSFHCWDGLRASDASYLAIAELGRRFRKPVWCLETGHNSSLHKAPGNPWKTWETALNTALVYERTIRLTGAELVDYWTYQHNYSLVDKTTGEPYPIFHVMHQMQPVFAPGAQIVVPSTSADRIRAIGSIQPSSGTVAILLVNSEEPATLTIHGLPAEARCHVTVRDDAGQERKPAEVRVSAEGDVHVAVPVASVVTVLSMPQ